jgi:hypothetical protein
LVPLNGSDAATLVEANLPNPTKVREKIAHAFAVLNVPHLQSPVRSRDDLLAIVLEAGDRASVRREGEFA